MNEKAPISLSHLNSKDCYLIVNIVFMQAINTASIISFHVSNPDLQ